jgi:hypothetical protein
MDPAFLMYNNGQRGPITHQFRAYANFRHSKDDTSLARPTVYHMPNQNPVVQPALATIFDDRAMQVQTHQQQLMQQQLMLDPYLNGTFTEPMHVPFGYYPPNVHINTTKYSNSRRIQQGRAGFYQNMHAYGLSDTQRKGKSSRRAPSAYMSRNRDDIITGRSMSASSGGSSSSDRAVVKSSRAYSKKGKPATVNLRKVEAASRPRIKGRFVSKKFFQDYIKQHPEEATSAGTTGGSLDTEALAAEALTDRDIADAEDKDGSHSNDKDSVTTTETQTQLENLVAKIEHVQPSPPAGSFASKGSRASEEQPTVYTAAANTCDDNAPLLKHNNSGMVSDPDAHFTDTEL